jgi:hypothetical protein
MYWGAEVRGAIRVFKSGPATAVVVTAPQFALTTKISWRFPMWRSFQPQTAVWFLDREPRRGFVGARLRGLGRNVIEIAPTIFLCELSERFAAAWTRSERYLGWNLFCIPLITPVAILIWESYTALLLRTIPHNISETSDRAHLTGPHQLSVTYVCITVTRGMVRWLTNRDLEVTS